MMRRMIYVLIMLLPALIKAEAQKQRATSHWRLKSNAVQKPADINIETLLRRSMFVKLYLSKTKVYLGEPLMAVYSFYTSVSGMPRVTHQPVFEGFGVKELNYDNGSTDEVINGETYSVYTVRKVQLTPVREGLIQLGSAYVNNDIELPSPGDPYSTSHYDIVVNNASAGIQVLPLPVIDVPKNFNGALGRFSITIKQPAAVLHTNETEHLFITIKGKGNFEAVTRPLINWPKKIEHYEGRDSQHVDNKSFPETGDITFDIPFIAKDTGNYTLPPIQFSYLDTESGKYETVATDSLQLKFLPAVARQSLPEETEDITNKKYLWIVAGIGFVVLLLSTAGYRKSAAKAAAIKKKAAAEMAAETTEPVISKTDFTGQLNSLYNVTDKKEFFCLAKEILSKAISEKLRASQNAKVFLLEVLKQQHEEIYIKASAFYETSNFHIYAPFETLDNKEVYIEQLRELIEELQAM